MSRWPPPICQEGYPELEPWMVTLGQRLDKLQYIYDLLMLDALSDFRRYLTVLYHLQRAYEQRLSSYLTVGALETQSYTYTIPQEYVWVPHIEDIEYSSPRTITRYDYEAGELKFTETYATDRIITSGDRPAHKIIIGSFGVSFYNPSGSTVYCKSRYLGTLMRMSDYQWWQAATRELGEEYFKAVT